MQKLISTCVLFKRHEFPVTRKSGRIIIYLKTVRAIIGSGSTRLFSIHPRSETNFKFIDFAKTN